MIKGVSDIESNIKKKYVFEVIALTLYIGLLILVMYFHEPWFDEAQAWLIARDATFKELFGSITHYEGHPPIWHLILMPFAKVGIPYEIGLKMVNLSLVSLAMGIFIFKAPFSILVRCTVPFTYFFFYQYGVISRTYSLMMLGFVLSAYTYKDRNNYPLRFVAALSLICSASAYGMIIAAGISLSWLLEIITKPLSLDKIKNFLNSRIFKALITLLIYNLILLFLIYPYSDTFATTAINKSVGVDLFYIFFVAPADATCTFAILGSSIEIVISIIMSLIIYIIILKITVITKKRSLFIMPYLFFGSFAGLIYLSPHHTGIVTMFYMFLLWCCFDEINEIERNEIYGIFIPKPLCFSGIIILTAMISVSIYWTIIASVNDINKNYGTGREAADFISDNNLDQMNILVAWRKITDPESGKCYQDYNYQVGTVILPYFNDNIFYNYNKSLDNKAYLLHKIDTKGLYTKKVINENYPDVLIWNGVSEFTFGSEVNIDDFVLVKSVHGNTIWKSKFVENRELIFIRKDLLKNYPELIVLNIEEELIKGT